MTIFIILLVVLILVVVSRPNIPNVITPNYLQARIRTLESSRVTNLVFLIGFTVVILSINGQIGLLDIFIVIFFTVRHTRIKGDLVSLRDQLKYLTRENGST